MALNRPAIDRFIGHFEEQAEHIESVQSFVLRKLLYATALDPLARAAFGNIGHRKRIVRLIDELTSWNARTLVSLPQLALKLSEIKRGRNRLGRQVRNRLGGWPSGHVLRISSSPQQGEMAQFAATQAEVKALEECRYPNLLYTYRNTLVHEFREPGYGMEFSTDKEQAYYTSTINGPWELVLPVGFFASIFNEAVSGARQYLLQHRINPYSRFEFGSLWRAR